MIDKLEELSDSQNVKKIKDSRNGKFLSFVLLICIIFILVEITLYLYFTDRISLNIELPFSNEGVKTCTYNGVKYSEREGFPAEDGCNRCSCTGGLVVCTLMACNESCIDTEQQCIGKENGSSCEMGVWCDKDGQICGGESCVELTPGICQDEVCQYLLD